MIPSYHLARTIIQDRLQSAENDRLAYQIATGSNRHLAGRNHFRGATAGPVAHGITLRRPRSHQATPEETTRRLEPLRSRPEGS